MAKLDQLSQWLRGAIGVPPNAQVEVKKAPTAKPQNEARREPSHPSSKPERRHGGHWQKRPQAPTALRKPDGPEKRGPAPIHPGVMRIIPIGGLEEVGKNSMVVENGEDILVVDMGFQFPEEEMLGVDYVIPDIGYLVQRKNRIRGILITHAHLDHIGAIPYVIEDLGFPTIYGSRLSMGLVKNILEKHNMTKRVTLKEVNNRDVYRFGSMSVDFFRVNHSIPDSLGLCIRSENGSMVHTGDFKFDFTPADGIESDIGKMAELGKAGVDIMFSDSTNALKPGHTLSEKTVGDNLAKAIRGVSGRLIIACFASLIGRIQQIVDIAEQQGRHVFFSGGSMVKNVEIGTELGFLKFSKGQVKPIESVNDFPDDKVLVLTTGSQGEPMAALSRMAGDAHMQIKIKPGDTVVLSASPIIGNERSVAFLVDALARRGANIVHNQIMDVHTSGHGQQEDLKLMMSLIRPKHLVPVHGNFYMRRAHGDLGPKMGIPEAQVYMMDNGNVIEVRKGKVEFKKEDIGVKYVVIDGLGQGDLGSMVQKERVAMSESGIVSIVVKIKKGALHGRPLIACHGFVYKTEFDSMLSELEKQAKEGAIRQHRKNPRSTFRDYEQSIRGAVSGAIVRKLDRRPLVVVQVLLA